MSIISIVRTLILSSLLLVGCAKPQVEETFVLNTKTPIEIEAEGSRIMLSFGTNCAWSIDITADADWIALDIASAEASAEVKHYAIIATIAGNEGDARSANLVIKYGSQGLSKVVTINQKASAPSGGSGESGKDPLAEQLPPCTVSSITDNMLFSTVPAATSTAVQQGFDFSPDKNYMFFTQINSLYKNILCKVPRAQKTTSTTLALASQKMTLLYFSHSNNIHYEKGTDGADYIWLGNFSTVQSDGKYNQPQILSRIKFAPGTTLKSFNTTDNYYFGTHNMHASFDEANDQLAVYSQADNYTMNIYRLSEVLAVPVTDVTLKYPITYGGEGQDEKTTVTPTIKAHDCTTLKPLYSFTYKYPSNGRSWQTYCIQNNKAYFFLCYSTPKNGMAYQSVIDVLDYKGNLLKKDILQPFSDNITDLERYSMTDAATKYMENEGIIIRDGILYLLYTGKNTAGFRRPCVFQFNADCLE